MDEEMMVEQTIGAEEQELAEPVETIEGAEEQELAEPVSEGKTDADAAFAELRRELEAERAEKEKALNALGLYFEGDDKIEQAIAYESGRTVEEVKAEQEAQLEQERLANENEQLSQELQDYKVREAMAEGLREIQSVDKTINSLDEVIEKYPSFVGYIERGLTSRQAYFASKAETEATKVVPAEPVGKVNASPAEKDFFTSEEVDAMTSQEIHDNYELIRKSMGKW